jgi:hypothetical protein
VLPRGAKDAVPQNDVVNSGLSACTMRRIADARGRLLDERPGAMHLTAASDTQLICQTSPRSRAEPRRKACKQTPQVELSGFQSAQSCAFQCVAVALSLPASQPHACTSFPGDLPTAYEPMIQTRSSVNVEPLRPRLRWHSAPGIPRS